MYACICWFFAKQIEVLYEQLVCILDLPQASELQASERQASKCMACMFIAFVRWLK